MLPIERVEPETFSAARGALCSNSGPVTEVWWWDSRNGGSGLHVFNRHGNVVLGWFTYAANGRPTWRTGIASYTASGPIIGTLYRTVSGPWQTSPAQNVAVGSFTLDRCDPAAMTLTWSLNATGSGADTELGAQRGVESLQRFCFDLQTPLSNGSCPGLGWPNEDSITGTYFQSELPGAGYSVETQGNRVGIVHYFFDGNGQPVWGTALVETTGAGVYSAALHVFTGAEVCPTCATDGQNRLVATGNFQLHYSRYHARMDMWLPLGGAAYISVPTSGAWPYAGVHRQSPSDDSWIGL